MQGMGLWMVTEKVPGLHPPWLQSRVAELPLRGEGLPWAGSRGQDSEEHGGQGICNCSSGHHEGAGQCPHRCSHCGPSLTAPQKPMATWPEGGYRPTSAHLALRSRTRGLEGGSDVGFT